jgi:hypothetical protein
MATSLPHFIAFDHVPAGTQAAAQLMIGPGGFLSLTNSTYVRVMANGTLGRNALRFTGNSDRKGIVAIPATTQVCHGVRIAPTTNHTRLIQYFVGGTEVLFFRVAGGVLELVRGATVLATGTTTVNDGAWRYLEVQIVFDNTVGTVLVHLDGVEEAAFTLSDVDTLNSDGQVDGVAVSGYSTGASSYSYFADMYFRDTMEFYGPIVPRILRPTSDVAEEWAPDSGTDNYARVADASGCDSDTSYVSTSTLDHEDEYGVTDLPAGVNSIVGVVVGCVGSAPEGGAPLVAPAVKVGATQAVADGQLLSSAYRTLAATFASAPDTSAWSESKVNAMTIGIKAA